MVSFAISTAFTHALGIRNGPSLPSPAEHPPGSPSPARIMRILLIDDHEIIREGLRALIERTPDWTVVGQAEDGIDGLCLAFSLKPDVVLTDMIMPGANGLEVTRRLRAGGFTGGIIMLSAHDGPDLAREAAAAGANQVMPKQTTYAALSAAIRAAATGTMSVPPAADVPALAGNAPALASLTPRETEILALIAAGTSSKEIADRLGISDKTVGVHRHRLQIKLGARGSSELTRIGVRAGLAQL